MIWFNTNTEKESSYNSTWYNWSVLTIETWLILHVLCWKMGRYICRCSTAKMTHFAHYHDEYFAKKAIYLILEQLEIRMWYAFYCQIRQKSNQWYPHFSWFYIHENSICHGDSTAISQLKTTNRLQFSKASLGVASRSNIITQIHNLNIWRRTEMEWPPRFYIRDKIARTILLPIVITIHPTYHQDLLISGNDNGN